MHRWSIIPSPHLNRCTYEIQQCEKQNYQAQILTSHVMGPSFKKQVDHLWLSHGYPTFVKLFQGTGSHGWKVTDTETEFNLSFHLCKDVAV